MLGGMAIPGDIVGEEEEEGVTEGVNSHVYRTPPPDFVFASDPSLPPFIGGKTRKSRKTRKVFYKGYGVVYRPGDIKGLTDKLHLLSAEFFAGNTTVRNELVDVLGALMRLKQLTRREYADINNRLASAWLYTRADALQLEDTSVGDLEL